MADQPKPDLKPVNSPQLIMAGMYLLKELGVALLMTLLELSRIKEKKTEDKLAYAETQNKILIAKEKVDTKYEEKTSAEVIGDFLGRPSGK